MENLTFYTDILTKHYHITDGDEQNEYLNFCLNEVKTNIINCYNNKHSTKNVITELFKRSMVKKWNELHQNKNIK